MPSVLWCCWLGGKKGIRPVEKLSGGVRAWLSFWSEMQTCIWPWWCHCHSLSLASVKSRLVLPLWYQLTWIVPEKMPVPHHSVFIDRMAFLPLNQQHQSTEGIIIIIIIARQLYPVQVISQVNAEKRPAWNVIADETVGQVFNVAGPLQVLL